MRFRNFRKYWLLLAGFAALVWFLIRVIPNPRRAMYPCQRAAFPMAAAFVLWAMGLLSSLRWVRRLKMGRGWPQLIRAGLFITLVAGFTILTWPGKLASGWKSASGDFPFIPTDDPNSPMGVARGIFPGRVTWVYDPLVVNYNGQDGNFWQPAMVDQEALDSMFHHSLKMLTGESTVAGAWSSIFSWFNVDHGKGQAGYRSGEKIAIKINMNTANGHNDTDNETNTTPHTILALARQLVEQAGIPDSCIHFYDISRPVPDYIYNYVKNQYPGVKFIDAIGGNGRISYEMDPGCPLLWSEDLVLEVGGGYPTFLPSVVSQADYIINLGNLKGHELAGQSICAKNHVGSLIAENPDVPELNSPQAAGIHPYISVHDYVPWNFPARDMGTYNTLVDMLGHQDLGGKTLLHIVDGLFATKIQHSIINAGERWNSEPFNGRFTSSVFMSLDGVSIESVALDFNRNENSMTEVYGNVDNYLHEASMAHDPPSGVYYDPEQDDSRLSSLGAHEHWNNAAERKYSRNMGTGDGVELLTFREGNHLPAAPGNLQAYHDGSSGIQLSWDDNSNNELIFILERWQSGEEGFLQLAEVTVDQVYYLDETWQSGVDIQYRMRAIGTSGESGYSNTVNIINSEEQAQQPVFSKTPDEYFNAVLVEISTSTDSATIYYTTDGSDPDDASTIYTTAILLTDTTTINAIAFAPGLQPSPIATGTYLVTATGPPRFSPSPVPQYPSPLKVTITVEPESLIIWYSDDGSDPAIPYTQSITLNQTTTLKAQAYSQDFTFSTEIAEVTYTIISAGSSAGTGPGGVGFKDPSRTGQPELSLWLKVDGMSGATNGASITEWPDASGNGNDGYNTWADGADNSIPNTGESQQEPPVYRDAVLNGLPALEFGSASPALGTMVVDDNENLDGGEGISLFLVGRCNEIQGESAAWVQKRDIRGNDATKQSYVFGTTGNTDSSEMQWAIAQDMFLGNQPGLDEVGYNIFNVGLDGDLGLGYFITNGSVDTIGTYTRTVQATEAALIIGGFQAMDMAELIIFNATTNMAQTRIVKEYLAAKYGLDLIGADGVMNIYDHKDYTFDLIGVGKARDLADMDDELHLHASGGALELKTDDLSAVGDFVLAAHNGVVITEDANRVWSRIWYVKTAGNGADVEMIFDFAKAGLMLSSADNYKLFHRADTTADWIDLGIIPSRDGNKLVFGIQHIASGYYVVGQGLTLHVSSDPEFGPDGFTLYPNPAGEWVYLSYSSHASGLLTIAVYDFKGMLALRRMVDKSTHTQEIRLDLSKIVEGLYIIELRHADKRMHRPLIVR